MDGPKFRRCKRRRRKTKNEEHRDGWSKIWKKLEKLENCRIDEMQCRSEEKLCKSILKRPRETKPRKTHYAGRCGGKNKNKTSYALTTSPAKSCHGMQFAKLENWN